MSLGLRESYAATHHANLQWNPDHVRAIDKVAASGRCDRLGVLLWKAKYMNEAQALNEALESLKQIAKERFHLHQSVMIDKVVDQVIHEFIFSFCENCGGRGQVKINDLVYVCQICDGTRVKRYTDFERARRMEVSPGHLKRLCRSSGPFEWVDLHVNRLDRKVNYVLIQQLNG